MLVTGDERTALRGAIPEGAGILAISGTGMIVLPPVQSGKIRGLGVTSRNRSPLAPEIPSIEEAGLPGFESITWY